MITENTGPVQKKKRGGGENELDCWWAYGKTEQNRSVFQANARFLLLQMAGCLVRLTFDSAVSLWIVCISVRENK